MKAMTTITGNNNRGISPDEAGFASIVVGLILVVVMALITVGFAQLSLHEQKQALSDQLSTQAYYAAETGVDDAIRDLTTIDKTDTNNPQRTYLNAGNVSGTGPTAQCMPESAALPGGYTANHTIDNTNDVSYTCLLVSLTSPSLVYDNVGPGNSRTVVVGAPNLKKLTIGWSSHSGGTNFGMPLPNLTTTSAWNTNAPGVIEFSVTPLQNGISRNSLASGVFTVYAYPKSGGGGTANYTVANDDGKIFSGGCKTSSTPNCSVTINQIPNGPTYKAYLIHFLDYYTASDVTITGFDNGANPVNFTGGQAVIDVTGKAQYVLRRIQVRIPLNSPVTPDFALQAQDICDRMETRPGNTDFIGTADDSTPAGASEPYCVLDTYP